MSVLREQTRQALVGTVGLEVSQMAMSRVGTNLVSRAAHEWRRGEDLDTELPRLVNELPAADKMEEEASRGA